MWENFRNWYRTNDAKITWFLIGFLTASGIDSLGSQNYTNAALCFFIAFVNYKFQNIKA